MIEIDTNSPTFWLLGCIWLTIPILSWLWSLVALYMYRRLLTLVSEATASLEQAKTLSGQMVAYRSETLEMRTKVEEELKHVCSYYTKISELISKNKT